MAVLSKLLARLVCACIPWSMPMSVYVAGVFSHIHSCSFVYFAQSFECSSRSVMER